MEVKLIVDGGAMKPGPVLSQKLGPAGIPINDVISKVNEATSAFNGMKVPITIIVDTGSKTFDIEISSPPISELLKKEAGIQKGSGIQNKQKVANLSIEQIISVAKQKMPNLLCRDLKSAVKITIGSCTSLGILVESKAASEVGEDVDSGMYDKEIEAESTQTPEEKRKQLDEYFRELKAVQDKKLKLETEAAEEATAAKGTDKAGEPAKK